MMQDVMIKPLLTAAVGTAAAKMSVLPERSVSVYGMQVPVWAVTFGALYGAALVGELSHDYILPHISKSRKFESVAGVVQPTLTGAANVAAWSIVSKAATDEKGMGTIFAIGALSEVVSDYVYHRFVSPLVL
jgi:hypothetical protein